MALLCSRHTKIPLMEIISHSEFLKLSLEL
nr:MAG TPA: hypothetical protein [Caudoviricetes sp.]